MMYLSIMQESFATWLQVEIKKRDWSPSDLARQAKKDIATISRVLNGDRQAGDDVCRAIADALGLPQWQVFLRAGLLTEAPRDMTARDYRIEKLTDRLMALPEPDRERLLAIAESMADMVEKKSGP
jgi:transcriptional regulator with XRE-family HTH domain